MKNMRKNTFEGDMEQFIIDAINDRDNDIQQPPEEEENGKEKTTILGNLLVLLAVVTGIAGLIFYFTASAPM
jgi:hypothetical protein